MGRPHFCSMKIPEDVRKYAAERFLNRAPALEHAFRGKAAEFRDVGAEIYSHSSSGS